MFGEVLMVGEVACGGWRGWLIRCDQGSENKPALVGICMLPGGELTGCEVQRHASMHSVSCLHK